MVVRQEEAFEDGVLRHDRVVVLLVRGARLGQVLGQVAAGAALREDEVHHLSLLTGVADLQIPDLVLAILNKENLIRIFTFE